MIKKAPEIKEGSCEGCCLVLFDGADYVCGELCGYNSIFIEVPDDQPPQPAPMTKTLRDDVALIYLNGLVHDDYMTSNAEQQGEYCYRRADEFLKAGGGK